MLGSLVSIAFNAGGVWSVMLLAAKRRRFNTDRPMLALTVAIYAYCSAMVLASIVNGTLSADLRLFLPLITFLLFPISYSTWSITEKTTLARIAILASAAACFGALAIAIVQYHWLGTRAEGGAGNAIVFATVTCLAVMLCLAGALSGIETRWKLLVPAGDRRNSGDRLFGVAHDLGGRADCRLRGPSHQPPPVRRRLRDALPDDRPGGRHLSSPPSALASSWIEPTSWSATGMR
ncbi:hypothetical protein ACVOMV_29200 [Mesorhizobium atlanticum]